MDPITRVIDATEEFLGHSPHPAIIALPLGAWAVSNICDVLGVLTDDPTYDDAARVSMGIGLIGAAGAALTGLRDYGYIPTDREPSHSVATAHGLGNAVVGSLFTASYIMRRSDRAAGRRTCGLARLLALSGGALALYTGWLGGKLVEEYGEAVQPVMEQQEEDEGEEHQDDRGRLAAAGARAPERGDGRHRER